METDDIEIGDLPGPLQPQQSQQQQQQTLDQDLLLQFSCMGTTDHEELVQQMMQILGFELTYSAAKFFLDMNNWNLQGAVGCYLDAYNNQRVPSMQIVGDVTVGAGEAVTPNTSFRQSWKIQNSGEESWPEGCYLKIVAINGDNVDTLGWINHIQASNNNLSDFERINLVESQVSVPALRPGNQTVCSVTLHSPAQCGYFQAKMRLCTQNGNFFGDTLWTIVTVHEAGTLALTQQVNDLHTSSQVSMIEGPPNLMDSGSGGLQLVEANSEFLFNRPNNSPEAAMSESSAGGVVGGSASSSNMESAPGGGGSAMDADLIPTNFN